MRHLLFAACATLMATPVVSHPHIFVEAGVQVHFDDQGQMTALTMKWTYDELFSLVILEDRGMDTDYDGVLTEDERTTLTGFDMDDWPEWYDGDLYVMLDGQKLLMAAPRDYDLHLVDGKLITTHTRDLVAPVDPAADDIVVQIYDEGFYTAYEITEETILHNAPVTCTAVTYGADLSAAQQEVKAAMAELNADQTLEEMGFPKVGAAFSDEVRISC